MASRARAGTHQLKTLSSGSKIVAQLLILVRPRSLLNSLVIFYTSSAVRIKWS